MSDNQFEKYISGLVDVMDTEENGGNNDGFIEKEEFMSYIGYMSDDWACMGEEAELRREK